MNIDKYLVNGRLCWTLTSNGYKYLTWNFVLHWRKAVGCPLLVICADRASLSFLQREGIRCILAETMQLPDFGPNVVPFGTRQFSQLNRLKLRLLAEFSQRAEIQECIYLDGDIIVYKNFLDDIQQYYGETKLLLQCDEQQKECSMTPCPNGCTGFVAFKNGIDSAIFKIHNEDAWREKPEDQVWVNRRLNELGYPWTVLPREGYPNGARASLTKNDPTLSQTAFLLHYNYRVGDSKKADMKRFGDWLLPY